MRVAVLVSGVGSTLEYFLTQDPLERNFEIVLVIADKYCAAVEVARDHGIHYSIIRCPDQETLTSRILDDLQVFKIDLVVMAGFMRLLAPAIFKEYEGRILGSHPSLLPLFPGKNAIEQTLSAKPRPKVSGCTIFLVDEGKDTGLILAQRSVPVLPVDTPETLRERIQSVERLLYYEIVCSVVALFKKLRADQ